MTRPPLRRLAAGLALAAAVTAGACVDGEYAHDNPFDPGMQLEMRIVGAPDTLVTTGQVIVLQLVTDPVIDGIEVEWSSTNSIVLQSLGDGVFRVNAPQSPNQQVEVLAQFGSRYASRYFIIKGTP